LIGGSINYIKISILTPRQFFTTKFLLSKSIFCFKNNLLLQMSFRQSLSSLVEDHQNPSFSERFQTSWNDRQAELTSDRILNKGEANRYSSWSLKRLCLHLCTAIYKIYYCDYTYVKLNTLNYMNDGRELFSG
jgi:hypothetical protein